MISLLDANYHNFWRSCRCAGAAGAIRACPAFIRVQMPTFRTAPRRRGERGGPRAAPCSRAPNSSHLPSLNLRCSSLPTPFTIRYSAADMSASMQTLTMTRFIWNTCPP